LGIISQFLGSTVELKVGIPVANESLTDIALSKDVSLRGLSGK
jgi:hypothetical protein